MRTGEEGLISVAESTWRMLRLTEVPGAAFTQSGGTWEKRVNRVAFEDGIFRFPPFF